MANKKAYKKKQLKKELASAIINKLEGLNASGQAKLHKYLDAKFGGVVNYYVSLLKKKKWRRVLPGEIKKDMHDVQLKDKDMQPNEIVTTSLMLNTQQ